MKILIYTWSLDNGGAERVASLWANGFADQRHKVRITLDSLFTPIKYQVNKSIAVNRLIRISPKYLNLVTNINKNIHGLLEKIWFRIPIFIKKYFIASIIKKFNPDIIIIVMPEFYNRISNALNVLHKRIPIIVTDHNPYERPNYAPLSKKGFQEKFIDSEKYDILTILTEADRLVLEKKMNQKFMNKVHVLPNPLTYPPQIKVPPKEKIILAAGRLDDWHYKGFDLLLKAWARIHNVFPNWKLKIAGGGSQATLKSMSSSLGITNRVEFLGFVNIKEYFEKASIFVLSSRYEGFGMVLTEAMSQGCACIACDYKGRQREIIIDDSQGLICPPDSDDAIAQALKKIILDDSYRQTIQKNAIERSKYFELPNIMKSWNNIFSKLNLK